MDYVPTVFAYAKPRVETSKQKEVCQRRVDRRRQILAEVAELGKENQEDAAGGLLQEIELTDVETQTSQTANSNAATQVSFASSPIVCSSSIMAESSCRYIRIAIEGER